MPAEKPLEKIKAEIMGGKEEEELEERRVGKVVDRLKKERTSERETKERSVAQMREQLVGAVKRARLNFGRVSGDLAKRDDLTFIGRFYTTFERPVSTLAGLLFTLPAAENLQIDLDSADIRLSVEAYLVVAASFAVLLAAIVFFGVGLLGILLGDANFAFVAPAFAIAIFVIAIIVGLLYPGLRANERAMKINRDLPLALRQLSTQIRAGVSFNKALQSIANAKYGVLSQEIQRVVTDMEAGESTEDALARLVRRTRSKGLKRALVQLVRALRTGGRLSDVVNAIAEDVSFETRMAVRDFTEILNLISVIYIVVAVVAPVTLTIISAIVQLPMLGGTVPKIIIYFAFAAIAVGIGSIIFITQRLEPST